MQSNFRRLLPVLTLTVLTTFTACIKEASSFPEPDNAAEVKIHADDQNNVSTELDAIATEADVALESDTYFSGRMQSAQNTTSICGAAAVADTFNDQKSITITYNGNNCTGTNFRTGTVVLSMPSSVHWRDTGASVTVRFQNLKIRHLSDNKSITINGTETLTNVGGGLLIHLATLRTVTHIITSSNLSITFDDDTQRTWQVARKRVFTYDNGVVLSISGIGISGTISNAAEWGTNRFGHSFTTSITNALVFRENCAWRLTAGEIKHQGFATATATFGLNDIGAPTPCPGAGKYYYKLVWTGLGGNSFSTIISY